MHAIEMMRDLLPLEQNEGSVENGIEREMSFSTLNPRYQVVGSHQREQAERPRMDACLHVLALARFKKCHYRRHGIQPATHATIPNTATALTTKTTSARCVRSACGASSSI